MRPDPAPVAGARRRRWLRRAPRSRRPARRAGQAVERARRGTGTLAAALRRGRRRQDAPRRRGRRRLGRARAARRGEPQRGAPYGPVVAALRAYLRARPRGFDGLRAAPRAPRAAAPRARRAGRRRATARRCSRRSARARRDRRERRRSSSSTTCSGPTRRRSSCSPASRRRSTSCRCSSLGAYRSDGLPRDHKLRWLRNELRRGGRLRRDGARAARRRRDRRAARAGCSAAALAGRSPRAIHDRTQGAAVLRRGAGPRARASGRLQAGPRGLELGGDEDVPVPDTVRDAVLMRAAPLSDEARAAAEAAAVAGQRFDLELVGAARERGRPRRAAAARHPARGRRRPRRLPPRARAGRRSTPTSRGCAAARCTGELAEALEARGGTSDGGRRPTGSAPATPPAPATALVRAARESEAVYAYRDATAPAARRSSCGRATRTRRRAARGARALRALRRAGGRAGRGGRRRGASSRRCRSARGERLAFARRPAPARRRLRAQGRARGGVRRAARRGRDVRRRRPARRRRASSGSRWPTTGASAPTTARRWSSRALAAAEARARRARRPARAGARARGRRARQARRVRRGPRDRPRRARARARRTTSPRSPPSSTSGSALVLYDSADYRRAEEALDTALGLCRPTATRAPRRPASPASPTCCASAASGRAPARCAAS